MSYESFEFKIQVGNVASQVAGGLPAFNAVPGIIKLDADAPTEEARTKEILYKLWINALAALGVARGVPDLGKWLEDHRHWSPANLLK